MEISFGEIVLICLIALVVLGPKEVVLRANQLGRWIARMRTQMNNLKIMAQEQILKEDEKAALHSAVKSLNAPVNPSPTPKKSEDSE